MLRVHGEQLITKHPHVVAESVPVQGLNGRLRIAEGQYRERWSKPVLLVEGPFSVHAVHVAYTWQMLPCHLDGRSIGCTDSMNQVQQQGLLVGGDMQIRVFTSSRPV